MTLRWERSGNGFHAVAGERVIGFIVQRVDGTWPWAIGDVSFSKYEPATRGQCSSLSAAKRAFRRGWRIWLQRRGLKEGA